MSPEEDQVEAENEFWDDFYGEDEFWDDADWKMHLEEDDDELG